MGASDHEPDGDQVPDDVDFVRVAIEDVTDEEFLEERAIATVVEGPILETLRDADSPSTTSKASGPGSLSSPDPLPVVRDAGIGTQVGSLIVVGRPCWKR